MSSIFLLIICNLVGFVWMFTVSSNWYLGFVPIFCGMIIYINTVDIKKENYMGMKQ